MDLSESFSERKREVRRFDEFRWYIECLSVYGLGGALIGTRSRTIINPRVAGRDLFSYFSFGRAHDHIEREREREKRIYRWLLEKMYVELCGENVRVKMFHWPSFTAGIFQELETFKLKCKNFPMKAFPPINLVNLKYLTTLFWAILTKTFLSFECLSSARFTFLEVFESQIFWEKVFKQPSFRQLNFLLLSLWF